MARRNSDFPLFGAIVIFAVVGEWASRHEDEIKLIGYLVLAVLVISIVVFTFNVIAQLNRCKEIIAQHADELTVRRKQLTKSAGYGLIDTSKWHEETQRFISQVLEPITGKISVNRDAVDREITRVTSHYFTARSRFSPFMSPLDYEHLVADSLRDLGWDTRTTQGSGDQGIDVIAEMRDVRVVIQCKLYSSPVGNAAVQQVMGGKTFAQAQHAAVVSNATYTSWAKALALSGNVFLLHHDELYRLEESIFGTRSQPSVAAEIIGQHREPVTVNVKDLVIRYSVNGFAAVGLCLAIYFGVIRSKPIETRTASPPVSLEAIVPTALPAISPRPPVRVFHKLKPAARPIEMVTEASVETRPGVESLPATESAEPSQQNADAPN